MLNEIPQISEGFCCCWFNRIVQFLRGDYPYQILLVQIGWILENIKKIIAQICYYIHINGREKKLQKKEGESKTFLENSCMESITGSFQVKNTEFQTFQVDMAMKQSVTVLCRLQCSSGQIDGMSSSPLNYWHRRELLLSILKLK